MAARIGVDAAAGGIIEHGFAEPGATAVEVIHGAAFFVEPAAGFVELFICVAGRDMGVGGGMNRIAGERGIVCGWRAMGEGGVNGAGEPGGRLADQGGGIQVRAQDTLHEGARRAGGGPEGRHPGGDAIGCMGLAGAGRAEQADGHRRLRAAMGDELGNVAERDALARCDLINGSIREKQWCGRLRPLRARRESCLQVGCRMIHFSTPERGSDAAGDGTFQLTGDASQQMTPFNRR